MLVVNEMKLEYIIILVIIFIILLAILLGVIIATRFSKDIYTGVNNITLTYLPYFVFIIKSGCFCRFGNISKIVSRSRFHQT